MRFSFIILKTAHWGGKSILNHVQDLFFLSVTCLFFTVINLFFSLKKTKIKKKWLPAWLKKKSYESPSKSSSPLWFLFSRYYVFSVLLINFILPSFSGLLNTDKCDIAYSSKSHKFMSCVTGLIYSRPDDEEAPCFFVTKQSNGTGRMPRCHVGLAENRL